MEGFWYVSVMDAGRCALVLGPFADEAQCRKWAYSSPEDGGNKGTHNLLVKWACERDPRAWFYAWGMVKLATGTKRGAMGPDEDGVIK